MTEKLFYEDSHRVSFTATVESCEPDRETFKVVLDRTAFAPEGGGQSADTGMLGNAQVLDVQEKDDVIYHTVSEALHVGAKVQGTIDWEERFSKMQQHSGEHIVSGLINKAFGYRNVGFHLGTENVTMDFNGPLTRKQLHEIEVKANEAVAKNLEIEVFYPSEKELSELEYRSKIEIEGQVRIVIIDEYDACACCAPHVKYTGEIGIIKLTNVQNYKGGVRVSMLCGFRALEDYHRKEKSVRDISVLLSAKEDEVADEVKRLLQELSQKKESILALQQKVLEARAEKIPATESIVCLFERELDGQAPRELMNLVLKRGNRLCAVFAGNDEAGYRYVIGSKTVDVRELGKKLNAAFGGRGGGKPEMIQGSVTGKAVEIEKFIKEAELI